MKDIRSLIESDKSAQEILESGDAVAYKAHYAATLKKFGAEDVGDLSDEDKKKFFKAVDDGYEAKNESINEAGETWTWEEINKALFEVMGMPPKKIANVRSALKRATGK